MHTVTLVVEQLHQWRTFGRQEAFPLTNSRMESWFKFQFRIVLVEASIRVLLGGAQLYGKGRSRKTENPPASTSGHARLRTLCIRQGCL